MESQRISKANQGDPRRKTLRSIKPPLSPHGLINPLLQFQRVSGNQAVGRLIQAKLAISQPSDVYEQEADRVADQVMRMPDPTVHDSASLGASSEPPGIQRQCPGCEERLQRETRNPFDEEEGLISEEEGVVQAKWPAGGAPAAAPGAEARIHALRGGGQPLPQPVRASMEPRFGHDFSQVRIHADAAAAEAAGSVNALAFTLGHNLVFGAGQYEPATEAGRRLLAHELTHVIQQGKASRTSRAAQQVHPSGALTETDMIRRVAWHPNTDTGRDSRPWGTGPRGDVLLGQTDAGTPIPIWRPHDGTTYWCHGYTFGGSTARGGPYSIWGQAVPTVLRDDGWVRQVHSCVARAGDVLVFYDNSGNVGHSGIVRSVSEPGGRVDEAASTLESKWGQAPLNTSSWLVNINQYGGYRCFSKSPAYGPCSGRGANELP
jgi:hypothetical protein